jgi:hypothetical protein
MAKTRRQTIQKLDQKQHFPLFYTKKVIKIFFFCTKQSCLADHLKIGQIVPLNKSRLDNKVPLS